MLKHTAEFFLPVQSTRREGKMCEAKDEKKARKGMQHNFFLAAAARGCIGMGVARWLCW